MRSLAGALAVVLWSTAALAQPHEKGSNQPPIQVGVGLAHFSMRDLDISIGGIEGAPELRLTIPFSSRFAFESVVMVGRQRYRSLYYDRDGEKRVHSTHTQGIYALQIRQRLRAGSRGRFESFATYGGTGYYDFITEAPATPLIFSDGRTVLGRNERQTGVIPPVATTVGFGIQQQLGRHVALRADAQLLAVLVIPFGFRASGTVSVPLGKYP